MNKKILLGIKKANVIALICAPILIGCITILFAIIWGKENIIIFLPQRFLGSFIMIFGVFLHEIIHLIFGVIFSKNGIKDVKLGILWSKLTPYCHFKAPLRIWEYLVALIMPGVILGFIPMLIGFIIGNYFCVLFGSIYTIVATGDILMVKTLLPLNKTLLVQDLSDECGYYIIDKNN